jgi:hypothetical protein
MEVCYWALLFMPLVILHHLLNIFVQLANKRGFTKKKKKIGIFHCVFQLSPTTLQGLHQIVQMVQIGDYAGSLSLHTQLVSGPDFSQIASFMPGLKVLLQSALQLQVYVQ